MNAMHIRKMTIAASMVAALVGATSPSAAADAARCVPAGWTLASGNADALTPVSTGSYYLARGFGSATDAITSAGFRASYRYSSSNGQGWNRGFRVAYVVND
jgi:hypothetical protein